MSNPIPPPPLDGTNRDPREREADQISNPERFAREVIRAAPPRRHVDPDAPRAEPARDRPHSEGDRGLDGFK
jgi:hypothetical protein